MIRGIPRRRAPVLRYSSQSFTNLNSGQMHLFAGTNEISRAIPKYANLVQTEPISISTPTQVIQPSCEASLEKLALINEQVSQLINLFSDPETTIETVITTLRS
jgi:hypothetical protein